MENVNRKSTSSIRKYSERGHLRTPERPKTSSTVFEDYVDKKYVCQLKQPPLKIKSFSENTCRRSYKMSI